MAIKSLVSLNVQNNQQIHYLAELVLLYAQNDCQITSLIECWNWPSNSLSSRMFKITTYKFTSFAEYSKLICLAECLKLSPNSLFCLKAQNDHQIHCSCWKFKSFWTSSRKSEFDSHFYHSVRPVNLTVIRLTCFAECLKLPSNSLFSMNGKKDHHVHCYWWLPKMTTKFTTLTKSSKWP